MIGAVYRHVPNIITGGRLLLSLVFFTMLSWYQYEGRGDPWLLNIAFIIYLIALISDFFDGYLARKWHAESVFGRIVDPFVDKIMVLGAFIFFAGKNFIIHDMDARVVKTITGVTPAMVAILLARELFVTSLRGAAERDGHNFGADWDGKVKMVLQSITVLAILLYVNYYNFWKTHPALESAARNARNVFIATTLIVTVVSGLTYIRKAMKLYRKPDKDGE